MVDTYSRSKVCTSFTGQNINLDIESSAPSFLARVLLCSKDDYGIASVKQEKCDSAFNSGKINVPQTVLIVESERDER